jgi:hypothetical protein
VRWKIFVFTTLLLTPILSGCVEEDDDIALFPAFSAIADNGELYDNQRMENQSYIVMFSAEWCNRPCYSTMHSMWNAQAELPVLVMSTDPAERAGGLTLEQWHESANAYDDDDNSTNNELTSYAFMKGDEVAIVMEITTPGTMIFVNSNGEITDTHEGKLDDKDLILSYWANANK